MSRVCPAGRQPEGVSDRLNLMSALSPKTEPRSSARRDRSDGRFEPARLDWRRNDGPGCWGYTNLLPASPAPNLTPKCTGPRSGPLRVRMEARQRWMASTRVSSRTWLIRKEYVRRKPPRNDMGEDIKPQLLAETWARGSIPARIARRRYLDAILRDCALRRKRADFV